MKKPSRQRGLIERNLSMGMVGEVRGAASVPTQREQSGQSDALLAAIRQCVPTKKAEVKAKLFRLAQLVRGIPGGIDDVELLRMIFQEWCRLSSGINLGSVDTLWAKFLDGCGRARFAIGENPAEEAWQRSAALSAPEAARFSDAKVRRLVSWFYELQKRHPSGAVFLSTHEIGRKMDVPPKLAWLWVKMLEREGILLLVHAGNSRQATRYRYASLVQNDERALEASDWESEDEGASEGDDSDQGEEVSV